MVKACCISRGAEIPSWKPDSTLRCLVHADGQRKRWCKKECGLLHGWDSVYNGWWNFIPRDIPWETESKLIKIGWYLYQQKEITVDAKEWMSVVIIVIIKRNLYF